MTILVTGANGQLGNEMRIAAKESNDKYIFTDVCDSSSESIKMLHKLAGDSIDISTMYLDITDIDAIRRVVKDYNVNAIVNCAAYTNVDAAESNYDLAELLNATAPENLAIVMREVGGFLIHISTDYVFGKELYNTPCEESQKGTPTGVYGLTKLHGEQKIILSGVKYVIIRTAWLYSEFGKNFVKTMLALTTTQPQLKVVFDQVGTPTYAWDLAELITCIIKRPGESGIYNYTNEGVCSWFDFSKMIAKSAEHQECDIQPCRSCEFPSKVKRPAFSVLDKTKVKNNFGIVIPYWTDSLNKCIHNLTQD